MRAVATDEALRSALRSTDAEVYGLVRPEEGLVQLLAARPSSQSHFRRLGTVHATSVAGRCRSVQTSDGPAFVKFDDDVPAPEEIEVIAVGEGLETRRAGATNDVNLKDARVLLVGAGSLGSEIVEPLAEAGVGRFDIVDRERLDSANLSRHPCDIADLDRDKATAFADRLRRRCVEAEAIAADVLQLGDERFRALVRGVDLAVVATDSPEAQHTTNELCAAEEVPAVFAAAYERGRSGEVVIFRPHATPCLLCCVGFRIGLGEAPRLKERRAAYQAADADRLVAEPGLAIDIRFLASVASAAALAVLDPSGSRAPLLRPDRSFVLIHGGSAPDPETSGFFAEPFELLYARIARSEACPVCGFKDK